MNEDLAALQHVLEDLHLRITARRKLPAHLKQLKAQHKQYVKEKRKLEKLVAREQEDVNKLNRLSVTSLFYQLSGRKRERLELEHQEYVAAALKYNACLNMIETLQYEIILLADMYAELPNLEAQYDQWIKKKERLVRKSYPKIATRIMRFDESIAHKHQVVAEIDQALKAGMRARSRLRGLLKELDKIARWIKSYGGEGQMGSAGRKQFVDRVGKKVVDTGVMLNSFEIELRDVFKSLEIRDIFDLRGFQGFLDVFHDNLITDWVVKSNLSNTRNNLTAAMDKVSGLLASLRSEKKDQNKDIRDIQKLREELILRHK